MKNWLVELITFIIILALGYFFVGVRGLGLVIWCVIGLFVDWLWWDGIVPGLELRRSLRKTDKNAEKKE